MNEQIAAFFTTDLTAMTASDELNLFLCLALVGIPAVAACRFARRFSPESVGKFLTDAALILALVVYLSVVIPGWLGILNFWSVSAIALAGSAILWRSATKIGTESTTSRPWGVDTWLGLTAALFAGCFLLIYCYHQCDLPPMSTDALVYQLPMPIDWIAHQRLVITPTWYWNPANSYAPAGPSSWFVWLLLPIRNDSLARFAQAPALLWIFALVFHGFCIETEPKVALVSTPTTASPPRRHSFTLSITALVAAAAILSRPLFSEAIFAKDDLIVTAVFLAALLSFRADALTDRLGPWRVGVALGLTLACKYTVLLVCPVLLFVVDAPIRARWRTRQYLIALGCIAVLAGPWYWRNLTQFGDPIYPADVKLFGTRLFTGLFGTERDLKLQSARGIGQMISGNYFGLPIPLLALLGACWLGACVAAGHSLISHPPRRAAVLGSIATFVVFLLASPHHEVRYLFPLIVLWFDSAALAIWTLIPTDWGKRLAAIVLLLISAGTAFDASLLARVLPLAGVAVLFTAGLLVVIWTFHSWSRLRLPIAVATGLVIFVAIYVRWHAYVNIYRDEIPDGWQLGYPVETPAWTFVRDTNNIPPEANIAFANTQFVYPLLGFDYRRKVFYAPTRKGLHSFVKLPRMGDKVPGDLIVNVMTDVMTADPDRATWTENLRAQSAQYLFVARHEMVPDPIELTWAHLDPGHFRERYADDYAVIFEIKP